MGQAASMLRNVRMTAFLSTYYKPVLCYNSNIRDLSINVWRGIQYLCENVEDSWFLNINTDTLNMRFGTLDIGAQLFKQGLTSENVMYELDNNDAPSHGFRLTQSMTNALDDYFAQIIAAGSADLFRPGDELLKPSFDWNDVARNDVDFAYSLLTYMWCCNITDLCKTYPEPCTATTKKPQRRKLFI